MPADPRRSIATIQSMSSAEKRWQPTPEAFLRMVDPALRPAAAAAPGAQWVGLAIERHLGLYVWVIIKGRACGTDTNLTELARASSGDDTVQQAWVHGLQALCVMDVPTL